jgi:hypothetical protein
MDIEQLNPDRYQEWDEFCLRSEDAWFWHTTEWLNYTQNYRQELESKPLSFMLINNHRIIGVCPLFLETLEVSGEKVKELSFGGSPNLLAALENGLTDKVREKRFAIVFEQINKLAKEYSAVRASIRASPLSPSYLLKGIQNFVPLKGGYVPISLTTQLIKTSKSIDSLWTDIRHGHAYDISRGMKYITTTAYDKSNITDEIYYQYQMLHHKAAGRVTRPQITFDLMKKWIKQGYATLFAASLNQKTVGFSFVYTYKNAAYYGSAANDPDFEQEPVGHVLQWKTIQWLKEHNYTLYEVGLQNYIPLPYCPVAPKEIAISTFKRGFGGFPVNLFIGEKYFSSQYYLEINKERQQRFLETIENKQL